MEVLMALKHGDIVEGPEIFDWLAALFMGNHKTQPLLQLKALTRHGSNLMSNTSLTIQLQSLTRPSVENDDWQFTALEITDLQRGLLVGSLRGSFSAQNRTGTFERYLLNQGSLFLAESHPVNQGVIRRLPSKTALFRAFSVDGELEKPDLNLTVNYTFGQVKATRIITVRLDSVTRHEMAGITWSFVGHHLVGGDLPPRPQKVGGFFSTQEPTGLLDWFQPAF
jgi:hypothetical protein